MPVAADDLVAFKVHGDTVEAPLRGLAGNASRGARIVRDRRRGNCLICHAMPRSIPLDTEMFQGEIGPSLDGVGTRLSALQERTRDRVPLEWAMTQNNLGLALTRLGERENGTERLEEAVVAYCVGFRTPTQVRVENSRESRHPKPYTKAEVGTRAKTPMK